MSPVVEKSESPVSSPAHATGTYVPKHRGAPVEPALKKGIKKSVLFSGIAVAATGVAVSGGVVLNGGKPDAAAAALASAKIDTSQGASTVREKSASRSDRRTSVDSTKALVLSQASGGQVTRTEDLASGDPRDIARAMLSAFGWSQDQFGCLDSLWTRESKWSTTADNPYSSAYGIPQALPGSKMSSAGPDWQYNPETQIKWGLGYIAGRYGSPCGAWGHSQSRGWY
jgi:hypothetical protein